MSNTTRSILEETLDSSSTQKNYKARENTEANLSQLELTIDELSIMVELIPDCELKQRLHEKCIELTSNYRKTFYSVIKERMAASLDSLKSTAMILEFMNKDTAPKTNN